MGTYSGIVFSCFQGNRCFHIYGDVDRRFPDGSQCALYSSLYIKKKQTNKQKPTNRQTKKQRNKETKKQRNKETKKQRNKETTKQTNKQSNKQKQTKTTNKHAN